LSWVERFAGDCLAEIEDIERRSSKEAEILELRARL
jgi:hypothetical protein